MEESIREPELKEENKKIEESVETQKESISLEEQLKNQLEEKEREIKQWKDLALRYAAEVENLKKSHKKEKEEYYKFALEAVFKELLISIDNLERALDAFKQSQNMEALREGVELTLKSILQTLEKYGLKPIIPSEGEEFQPYLHEALSTEEHPEIPNGRITKVYQKGYKLHERVIRPALVCVSVGKKEENLQAQKENKREENVEEKNNL